MTQKTEIKTKLQPLGARVLAQKVAQEETLKGGIILPDSAQKKQETAIVIAVGPGIKKEDGSLEAVAVNVGDQILLDKYAGQQVTIDQEEYIIVKSDDIIATILK